MLRLKGFAEAGLADPAPYQPMKIAEIYQERAGRRLADRRRERVRAHQRLQLAVLVLRHAVRFLAARG